MKLETVPQNISLFYITYFDSVQRKTLTIKVRDDEILDTKRVLERGNYTSIAMYRVDITVKQEDTVEDNNKIYQLDI
jgi:hypothetical protein